MWQDTEVRSMGSVIKRYGARWWAPPLAGVAVAAVAVTAAAAAGAWDDSAPTPLLDGAPTVDTNAPITLPGDAAGTLKRNALNAAPSSAVNAPAAPTVGLLDPAPNVGDRETVAIVEAAVEDALTRDQRVGALIGTATYQRDRLARSIRLVLPGMYAADALAEATTERINSLTFAAEDPTYNRYDDARWVTTTWQGVQLPPAATTATAVVTGHYEYLRGGHWISEAPVQQQLTMSLSPQGAWLIETLEGVPVSDNRN